MTKGEKHGYGLERMGWLCCGLSRSVRTPEHVRQPFHSVSPLDAVINLQLHVEALRNLDLLRKEQGDAAYSLKLDVP